MVHVYRCPNTMCSKVRRFFTLLYVYGNVLLLQHPQRLGLDLQVFVEAGAEGDDFRAVVE